MVCCLLSMSKANYLSYDMLSMCVHYFNQSYILTYDGKEKGPFPPML